MSEGNRHLLPANSTSPSTIKENPHQTNPISQVRKQVIADFFYQQTGTFSLTGPAG